MKRNSKVEPAEEQNKRGSGGSAHSGAGHGHHHQNLNPHNIHDHISGKDKRKSSGAASKSRPPRPSQAHKHHDHLQHAKQHQPKDGHAGGPKRKSGVPHDRKSIHHQHRLSVRDDRALPSTSKKVENTSEESSMETGSDDSETELPYPPAYWEEKVANAFEIIDQLEKSSPEMKRALIDNPLLTEEFMRHPHIAREVAKDPYLGKLVIARPALIVDLSLAHHEIVDQAKKDDKNHPLHRDSGKQHRPSKGGPNPNKTAKPHNIPGVVQFGQKPKVGTSDDSDSEITKVSRATLPNIHIPDGEPNSLKYLAETARLYMTHHVEVADGCSTCCDATRDYFDVLNVYGRLMYRVYEGQRSYWNFCGIFRPFEMAVKEPNDSSIIVMTKRYDLFRSMRKISIYCPPGQFIGSVEEKWGICSPKLVLRNHVGDAMIEIRVLKRPFMSRFRYHPNFELELRTIGAHNAIGKITAEWLDLPPGAFPNEKVYGINFPKELNCKVKIIVMTAWLLVYKLYFNGKLKKLVRHDLKDSDRALLEFAAVQPKKKSVLHDPLFDSEESIPHDEKGSK